MSTPIFEIRTNYTTSRMSAGTVCIAAAYLNGVVLTAGVTWGVKQSTSVVAISNDPSNRLRIRGVGGGNATVTATYNDHGMPRGATLPCVVLGAPVPIPVPTPPPVPVLDIVTNYATDRLSAGETIIAHARLDGVVLTSGVVWSVQPTGSPVIAISNDANDACRVIAKSSGACALVATHGAQSTSKQCTVLGTVPAPTPTPTPDPVPTPTPTRVSPMATLQRIRKWITMVSTNFYYNWTSAMYAVYAARYDVVYSGSDAVVAALKALNPRMKHIKYATEVTVIEGAGSLEDGYESDYVLWCQMQNIPQDVAEMGYLHVPGGTTLATRVHQSIWGSPRDVPDPTSAAMRKYQVDRLSRVVAKPNVDGVFLDEFGSGPMREAYKLSAPNDAVRLQAICDAETTLIQAIADAVAPKEVILNTASYAFPWDEALAMAALGTHLEQTNNPLVVEMIGEWWPWIDKLLRDGDFVNMVPPYQWGEYESQHDSQPVVTHMDSARGKLLELASYYMCVPQNPSLLGLSIENGAWGKYTPVQNWLPQIDADIGLALEVRQQPVGMHYFTRRFEHGLVVVNPVWNRNAPNYGDSGATVIQLRNDRKYAQVMADGSIGPVVTSITLRCPEAAIFVVVP